MKKACISYKSFQSPTMELTIYEYGGRTVETVKLDALDVAALARPINEWLLNNVKLIKED